MLFHQGEDIYDVAPTSTETVKDFSKLIGRFDQKPRPGSVYPGKGATQSKRPVLAPVQLPPKKGPMGPLSPAAIVSPQLVNSVRKQLSVVPNKRASAMGEGAVNPTRPTSQAGEAVPPVIPSKKAAPPPIAEAPEPSPTQSETQSAIDQRPPKAVPVTNVRPISTCISQVVPGSPTDQHSNDKMSRASKVSTGYDNVPPAPMNYKQLSLPPMDGPPPPKPSKPPHVELPSLEDGKCPVYDRREHQILPVATANESCL